MATLSISKELFERLAAIAAQENQDINALAETLLIDELGKYVSAGNSDQKPEKSKSLEALIGVLDTDETDLSITVRETLTQHTHPKYGWTADKDDHTD